MKTPHFIFLRVKILALFSDGPLVQPKPEENNGLSPEGSKITAVELLQPPLEAPPEKPYLGLLYEFDWLNIGLWNTIFGGVAVYFIVFLATRVYRLVRNPLVRKNYDNRLSQSKQAENSTFPEQPEKPGNETQEIAPYSLHVNESNLIDYQDSFVGRENELALLDEYLLHSRKRLVTLYGPGGIGKTRLSHKFGLDNQSRFKDGVIFVDLRQASTLEGIAEEVLKAFGTVNASSQISAQDAVVEFLKGKNDLLIILDNFEQVHEFYKNSIEYWIRKLHTGVRFLVTSRERFDGEFETGIKLDSIDKENSVKLFYERCLKRQEKSVVDQLFANEKPLVDTICRKLDGIPLAIEIVSAQTKSKSLKQIHQSMRKRFLSFKAPGRFAHQKHQTLYDAINWSYNLLSSSEKNVFIQMGIFQDGCDTLAFEAIIKSENEDSASELNTLIDKSLVKVRVDQYHPRYDMYVPIKDFAVQELGKYDQHEYKQLYERWSEYYIGYIEAYNKKLNSDSAKKSMDLIELEFENIYDIQLKALEFGEPNVSAKAILSISKTLEVRGPSKMRIPKLFKAHESFGEEKNTLLLKIKIELAKAYWAASYWDKTIELLIDARNLATDLHEFDSVANIYKELGNTFGDRGNHHKSKELLVAGLSIMGQKQIKNPDLELQLLTYYASSSEKLDDIQTCVHYLNRAENIARNLDNKVYLGLVHNKRGLTFWHHGRIKEALDEMMYAAECAREVQNKTWKPAHLTNKGLVLADAGRYSESISCFREADVLHNKLGYRHWAAVNYGGWGRVLMMQDKSKNLAQAESYCRQALTLSEEIFYPENLTMHLGDIGRILTYQNRFGEAYPYAKRALSLTLKIGSLKTIRHFSNLATLYKCTIELGKKREALIIRELLGELFTLDFVKKPDIPKIQEDLAWIEEYDRILEEQKAAETTCAILDKISLSETQILSECRKIFGSKFYHYPWYFLESDLEKLDVPYILLFTYGSLLNRDSALKTIGEDQWDNAKQGLAFGVKRLFNYNIPDEVASREMYVTEVDIQSFSVLNVDFSGLPGEFCNGLIIKIPQSDIESLRKREIGYDLVQVKCYYPETGQWEEEPVYTLSCEHRLFRDRWLTKEDLPPHPNYLEVCASGAKSLGEDFFHTWRETTFLGDGVTKLKL